MSRLRALLAIMLAVTWCSTAWHVDLEAAGMMLEHQHHAHDDHDAAHDPVGAHDDHQDVFARDVANDQMRIAAPVVLWFTVVGLASWLIAARWQRRTELTVPRRRRETDPPFTQIWQFVRRCAPESAAPPALG